MNFNIVIHEDADRTETINALQYIGWVIEFNEIPLVLGLDGPDNALEEILAVPGVKSAAPDQPMHISTIEHLIPKGVPSAVGQWNLILQGQKPGVSVFNNPYSLHKKDHAARFTYDPTDTLGDGTGVLIYIVDSGIQANHEDFGGRVAGIVYNAYSSAPYSGLGSHGTWCASAAAGGKFGIAPGATLMDSKVFDDTGTTTTLTITAGLNACLSHFNNQNLPGIVNCSFSGQNLTDWSSTVMAAIVDAGLIPVAAAGNDGLDLTTTSSVDQVWPAQNTDTITVGGHEGNMRIHSMSNRYDETDIYAAFDGWVLATGGYGIDHYATLYIRGTSFACPMVAGMLARYLTGQPKPTTRAEVEAIRSAFLSAYSVMDVRSAENNTLLQDKGRLWVPGVSFVDFVPYTPPEYFIPEALPIETDQARTYVVIAPAKDYINVRTARTYVIVDTV